MENPPEIFLPERLLKTFFDRKPIRFKTRKTEEWKNGTLSITPFSRGACSSSIIGLSDENLSHGVFGSACLYIDHSMIDSVSWDEKNKVFYADFSNT
ncbi:hypothetical protein [Puniceicoccus vermicola]|uniref:Uncharacterized protein n=1 Tax=Puniceicoccus vermicola TaxID=388746 RepID=A0A7X1E623_9BACT|nr:hypothetical protein [Puniceicoccus vermicola]MBC2603754.1 hypothetical protein [Puniceicoccus vermicola]